MSDTVRPPWLLGTLETFPSDDLTMGDALAQGGEIEKALGVYTRLTDTALDPVAKRIAFVRKLGTELKLGRSREVLDELAKYVRQENIRMADLEPRLAVVAAFAYLHQNNINQSLAWFGVAYHNASPTSLMSEIALGEAQRVLRSIEEQSFEEISAKWVDDPFISGLFREERGRRSRGGAIEPRFEKNWFRPETYSLNSEEARRAAQDTSALNQQPVVTQPSAASEEAGELVIGILLPFTGQFAEHAERVKRGIELAIEVEGGSNPPRIVQADTAGNPERASAEYERLVNQEHVKAILGPMEVKGTETVAAKSRDLRVPFFSFTKREGIPGLSPALFRLGVTASSQSEELVNYAVDILHFQTASVVYPENESGRELAAAFQENAINRGLKVIHAVSYQAGVSPSMEQAVTGLEGSFGDVVFVPDSVDSARPLIAALRAKKQDVVLMGPALWNDPPAVRHMGYLLENAYCVAPFFPFGTQTAAQDFRQKFQAKYNAEPDVLSAQAYDATTLLLRTVNGKSASPETIISQVHEYRELRGVTGTLTVEDTGEIDRRMTVLQIKDGSLNEVMVAGELIGVIPEQTTPSQVPADPQSGLQ